MFSLTTKLHMLLITIVACVATYMYILYKEIKVFESDILVLKLQVASLMPLDVNKIIKEMHAVGGGSVSINSKHDQGHGG